MTSEYKVGITMPARNEYHLGNRGGLLEKILDEIPKEYTPKIYVCANNSDSEFVSMLRDIGTQDDRIKVVDIGSTKSLGVGWAYSYLHILDIAKNESDFVIEMDANGAHDPVYISDFLGELKKGAGAAFSTRFSHGGSIHKYSTQRKMISALGTVSANIALGLGQIVPDMTSGYEAFRSEVLGEIFAKHDIRKWLSVTRGPGHFYQTEMRAKVIWNKNRFAMVPIVWGNNRMVEPEKLPFSTVIEAFKSLLILRSMKNEST